MTEGVKELIQLKPFTDSVWEAKFLKHSPKKKRYPLYDLDMYKVQLAQLKTYLASRQA